ncbi:MAG: hypothetical protein ACIAXF_05585 [Phycisphaerales bacterium JB063]
MLKLTRLPLAALVLLVLLTGCKKSAAFLIIDAQTQQPIAHALVDHRAVYDYTDPRGGSTYLKSTEPANAEGWIELDKPQSSDSYFLRAPGYQTREVRMTRPGKLAEYMVVGGPDVTRWIEVEPRDNGDDDVPTFVIPVDPN